jgi:hypothetical protein
MNSESQKSTPLNKNRRGRGNFKSDWRGSDKNIPSNSQAQSSSVDTTKPLAWRSKTVETIKVKGNNTKESSSESLKKSPKETPKRNHNKSSEVDAIESSLSKLALGHQDTKSTPEIGNYIPAKSGLSYSTPLRSSKSRESLASRILELFDFPTTFKTSDIHSFFKDIRNDAYRIKWRDERSSIYLIFKDGFMGE